MKLLSKIIISGTMLIIIFLSGCELVTKPAGPPREKLSGTDLVINEVFTLSPEKYYAYSWIELFNPTSKRISWFDQSYPATMYAVGTNSAFIQTDNDGLDWHVLPGGTPAAALYAIDFPYGDTAYAVGDNGLIRKFQRDTSGSFVSTDLSSGTTRNLRGVAFGPVSTIGFVAGDGGLILRTINRGVSWTAQTTTTTKNLHDLVFIEFPSKIYAVGDSGTILRKASGISWGKQTIPLIYQSTNFFAVSMATDTGFVVGENGKILFTKNGSANNTASSALWTAETSNVSSTLRTVFVSDHQGFAKIGRAWAAGDEGVIIRTDDYGKHWTKQISNTTARINKISFSDSLNGWAFGDGGLVLTTTNGGGSWRQQFSRTTENLLNMKQLPLNILVQHRYVLEMVAKRKEFFRDPFTGTINFDFYVKIDSGILLYDPLILFQQSGGAVALRASVPPNGFVVINSDSVAFNDHTKLGPGTTNVLNVSIGYYLNPGAFGGATAVKWDLLSSGEIRLLKFNVKSPISNPNQFLGFDQRVIEVLRYGNYVPTTAVFPPDQLYLNNEPLGFIPEGYSIARYADDGGGLPADLQSTKKSFFFAKDPIPGWFSQESKPQ